MHSVKIKSDNKNKKTHSKKEKQLIKLINDSESDGSESEHELSYYMNDRVKLMKQVLKIIKPKKIKSMAPNCMKNFDHQEINSMLLEELLGISNKRLKYIFNGENLDEESSSTDPEDEQQPIDIISLDDISDDDFVIDLGTDSESNKKRSKKHKTKIKDELKKKKVKKEKQDKDQTAETLGKNENKMNEQNLMSVLELLELQARARAIRSQLTLESSRKAQEKKANEIVEESENEDAVIVESPNNVEIVITSSESENEDVSNKLKENDGVEDNGRNNYFTNSEVKDKMVEKTSNASSNKLVENEKQVVKDCDAVEDAHRCIKNFQDVKLTEVQQNPKIKLDAYISKESDNIEEISQPKASEEKEPMSDNIPQPECKKNNEEYEKQSQVVDIPLPEEKSLLTESIKPVDISDTQKPVDGCEINLKNKISKKHRSRHCRRHKLNKPKHEAEYEESKMKDSECNKTINEKSVYAKEAHAGRKFSRLSNTTDEGDGIVLNVDQSEMDCILLD